LPIFNGTTRPTITTYDGWRAPLKGDSFDPQVDRFLDISKFTLPQPIQFGNATRVQPQGARVPGVQREHQPREIVRIQRIGAD
jgi:hypothetical protein